MIVPILFLIIIIVKYSFILYHKKLYLWHCKNIYPFHKKLSEVEENYIYRCIYLSYWEILRPLYLLFDPQIKKLSYFTYSHHIYNNKINSSRIAFGSSIHHKLLYKYALDVLNFKNIKCEIFPNKNIIFGGLGWDIKNNLFKIYFRFFDYRKLNSKFKKIINKKYKNKSGLLSITYKNTSIYERKVYIYDKDTILISKKRKEIQKDLKKHTLLKNITKKGNLIINKYNKEGYYLDTINYRDKNNYILYFPL